MGNALTGDFDAVLQVSEGTFRRLVAGLHRNDRSDPSVPSLPHRLTVPVDRGTTRGTLVAQVGVPLVSFIDGATDRVGLAVGVRGLFTAAEGSDPLPPFIHGTVHAEYVFRPVDPATPGWGAAAAEHIRFRVDPATVRFTGTMAASLEDLVVPQEPPEPRLAAVLVDLLEHGLAATPHRVGSAFRPDRLVTLSRDGAAAVAVPVAGAGDPRSVRQVFLQDSDVAVAVSQEALLGRVRPALEDLRQRVREVVRLRATALWDLWEVVDIRWGVSIAEATATWAGPVSGGGRVDVRLVVAGRTEKHEYDREVEVTQAVHVALAPSGWLSARPLGGPEVAVRYDGAFADRVRPVVEQQAGTILRPHIDALLDGVGVDLGLRARADDLARQLRRLDPAAEVGFHRTRFTDAGVVAFGRVALSPQRPWEVTFTPDPSGRGYSALDLWVPGGRVDTYTWRWRVTGASAEVRRTFADRWVLWPETDYSGLVGLSRFDPGVGVAVEEVPGLGGVTGSLSLDVTGVIVDDVSGELSPFAATSDPIEYTVPPHHTRGSLATGMTTHGGIVGGAELTRIITTGLGDALGYGVGYGTAAVGANLLLVRAGPGPADGLARSLRAGLAGASVEGAGLQVVVLVEAGRAGAWQQEAATALRHELRDLVGVAVYEDVEGDWARSIGLPDGDATWTALVSPQGGVPWAEPGTVGGPALAAALDTYLVPSAPPRMVPVAQTIRPGAVLSPWALARASGDGAPPPPIGRTGRRTVLAFVRPGVDDGVVDRVRPALAPTADDALVAVVAHGGDDREVSRSNLLADDVVVADPDGALARRLGVTIWPTTALVDADGTVVRVLTASWAPRQPIPPAGPEEVVR